MIPPLSEITVSPSQFDAAQALPDGLPPGLIDLLRAAAAAQTAAVPSQLPAPGGMPAAAPLSPTPAPDAVHTADPPSSEPTSGTAMMTTPLVSPAPLNAVSNVAVAAYQGIQYWVDYGVQLAQSAVGLIPLLGSPIDAQIEFVYWDLIRPIANSIVYDLIVPVLNAPLDLGVWANGVSAVATASANALTTFGWNELNYFIPLPPLPSAATATAAAQTPVTPAERISSIPSLVRASLAPATVGPAATGTVAPAESVATTTAPKNTIVDAASPPEAVVSTDLDPPTPGAAARANSQTAGETPVEKPPASAKATGPLPTGADSAPGQVRSDLGEAATSISDNLRPGNDAGRTQTKTKTTTQSTATTTETDNTNTPDNSSNSDNSSKDKSGKSDKSDGE